MNLVARSLFREVFNTTRQSDQIVPPSLGTTYLMEGRSAIARATAPPHPWARATSPEISN